MRYSKSPDRGSVPVNFKGPAFPGELRGPNRQDYSRFRSAWRRSSGIRRSPMDLTPEERHHYFPFNLSSLPFPFLGQHGVDAVILCGPSRYDLSKAEPSRFIQSETLHPMVLSSYIDVGMATLLPVSGYRMDREWKIILGESVLNVSAAGETIRILYSEAARKGLDSSLTRNIVPYHEASKDLLTSHNIICFACGDNNPVLPLALTSFEMLYDVTCPVHHDPYDTSEAIYSEVSRTRYEKGSEAGYITLIPNPWNREKAFMICGGNTGLGTQAALLRANRAFAGVEPISSTRAELPYKIVSAKPTPGSRLVCAQVELE